MSQPTQASPHRSWFQRHFRLALGILLGVNLGGLALMWLGGQHQLRENLPRLDGTLALSGLSSPVHVERDGLGIPTIRAATRLDVARATGFLHGQERFFQMDLARRAAAGEYAALFGAHWVQEDEKLRQYRFRARSKAVLAAASLEERALLQAYAEGVNAGLRALAVPPFEYAALGKQASPWQAEDCVLVLAHLFILSQDATATREARVGLTEDLLPPALAAFLLAPASEWEAPLLGGPSPTVAIPGPGVIDLRSPIHRESRRC